MTLDEWMLRHDKLNAWLAQQAGVHEVTVSRWRRHTKMPQPEHVRRIQAITEGRVRPADWFKAVRPLSDVRKARKRLRRRARLAAGAERGADAVTVVAP